MKHSKLLALLLALAMIFALTACRSAGGQESAAPSEPAVESTEPAPTPPET